MLSNLLLALQYFPSSTTTNCLNLWSESVHCPIRRSCTQINIVVFILVIRKMMGTKCVQDKTQLGKLRAGVKASVVVLPLLGITWLFGLLSFSTDTIVFKYIFTIFNSLQGLTIFIFHCVLNSQVRKIYR